MSKINIDNELCNYIDANDGQVTLGGLAEHFAEYGYQYAQDHPAWVSVEKELPRERGHYLAYTEYGQVWLTEYMQDKGGYWDWFVAPICVGAVSKVTHWMPLPQPPVKKGGEGMIATCIETDPLQALEVGKDYEIVQINGKFFVPEINLALSEERFRQHFVKKGGEQ